MCIWYHVHYEFNNKVIKMIFNAFCGESSLSCWNLSKNLLSLDHEAVHFIYETKRAKNKNSYVNLSCIIFIL